MIEGTTTQEMLENARKIIEGLEHDVEDLKKRVADKLKTLRRYHAVELLSVEQMYWDLWSRRSSELAGLLKDGTISLCIVAGHRIDLLENRKKDLGKMLEGLGELGPGV